MDLCIFKIQLREITLDIENAKKLQYEKFKELVENFVNLRPDEFENYVLLTIHGLDPIPIVQFIPNELLRNIPPATKNH